MVKLPFYFGHEKLKTTNPRKGTETQSFVFFVCHSITLKTTNPRKGTETNYVLTAHLCAVY